MKILSMAIKNFRLLADVTVTFPPSGITGIIGSNEAGKSTLVEAAIWALYGAAAVRGTMEGVRWKGARKAHPAEVELAFEVGGVAYTIQRSEKSALLEQGTTVIAEGVAPVNKHIVKLLGMSHAEFAASLLCRQRDLNAFAAMKPVERQTFVRRMVGVGRIDDALKAVRARRNELATEIGGLEMGLGERGALADAVVAARGAVELGSVRSDQARAMASIASANYHGLLERAQTGRGDKARHEQAATALSTATADLQRAERDEERACQDLTAAENAAGIVAAAVPDLAALPSLRDERDQLVEARARMAELDTCIMTVHEHETEIARLQDGLAEAAAKVAAADPAALASAEEAAAEADTVLTGMIGLRHQARTQALTEAAAARKDAERHVRRIAAIREAGVDGACPTCTRRLAEQFTMVVDALEEERESATTTAEQRARVASGLSAVTPEEGAALKARDAAEAEFHRLRALAGEAREAERTLVRHQDTLRRTEAALKAANERWTALSTVAFDAARLQLVASELARLVQMDRDLAAHRGLAAQVPALTSRYRDAQQVLVLTRGEVSRARAALQAIAFDPQAHAALEADAEAARAAHEQARVSLAGAEEGERGAARRLQDAQKALADYDRRAEAVDEKRAQHLTHERAAVRLEEFRLAAAATIRPDLEEYASGFVHLLTDGRHEAVTIGDDFAMTLYEGGVPVEVASGGTEDVAALAMRLAISQLITQRAGHDLGLLVLDEIFGSLDEQRRGNVMGLLRRLRETFPQVLLISHVAETRDMVDAAIELVHDEERGCTRVA